MFWLGYLKNNNFNFMLDEKCPECGTANIWHSGPFAEAKLEGQPSAKGHSVVNYHCHDCNHDWFKLE